MGVEPPDCECTVVRMMIRIDELNSITRSFSRVATPDGEQIKSRTADRVSLLHRVETTH